MGLTRMDRIKYISWVKGDTEHEPRFLGSKLVLAGLEGGAPPPPLGFAGSQGTKGRGRAQGGSRGLNVFGL